MKSIKRHPGTLTPTTRQLEWLKGVMLAFCLLAGLWGQADESKAAKYVPLDEILRKWQAVSLSQTAAAAEQGDLTAQHFLGYYHFEGLGGKINLAEGLNWYRRAAAAGFPNSLNNLGAAYLQGRGVERDETKALNYFRQAAAKGFWPSLRTVAGIVAQQKDGEKEKEAIRRQLEKAARAGDSEAQIQLAYFVLNPPGGGLIEHDNAFYLFRKAAEQGRTDAMTVMGNLYMENSSVRDYVQAHKWHRLAAEKEQPASEAALGWMYFHGFGVKADQEKAFEWTRKAAERNHTGAMLNMGRFLAGDNLPKLPDDFRPNYVQAAQWYGKAVNFGDAWAKYYLGKLIWQKRLPGRDRHEARALVMAAAEARVNPARELLGEMDLETAEGTEAAVAVLERLALEGETSAMVRLANEYRQGKSAPTDHFRAAKLYLEARNYGEVEAHQALAVLNAEDQPKPALTGVNAKFATALSQMVRALKQKDAAFYRELGGKYSQGDSLPKDIVEACAWLRFSAHEGNVEAQKEAEAIIAQLNEEQKLAAETWLTRLMNIQAGLLETK
jgi:hypothetical protein